MLTLCDIMLTLSDTFFAHTQKNMHTRKKICTRAKNIHTQKIYTRKKIRMQKN